MTAISKKATEFVYTAWNSEVANRKKKQIKTNINLILFGVVSKLALYTFF